MGDERPPPIVPGVARFLWQLPDAPVDRHERVIALTFDDGPFEPSTPAVLDALAAAEVAATFFVVGENVRERGGVMRAIADHGHTIGVHGWSHTLFTKLDPSALDDELDRCIDAVAQTTGRAPRHVRPPYGAIDADTAARLAARGLVPVKWSVDPEDWRDPTADEIVTHIVDGLAPGQIVLLHDGSTHNDATIAALPPLVAAVRDRGYEPVAL